jgi:hypothetical protein
MDKRKDGWKIMKKILLLVPIVAILAACGTTDVYQKRAEAERDYRERAIDQALKKRPEWMSRLPISNSAVFAAAEGTAGSYNMAVHLARTNALTEICYSAGGTVDSQTKQFETSASRSSSIEKATRTRCNAVDVTGIETYGAKDVGDNPVVIRSGDQYTAYVLLALPTGDANVLRKSKEQAKLAEQVARRAPEAFKELDKN